MVATAESCVGVWRGCWTGNPALHSLCMMPRSVKGGMMGGNPQHPARERQSRHPPSTPSSMHPYLPPWIKCLYWLHTASNSTKCKQASTETTNCSCAQESRILSQLLSWNTHILQVCQAPPSPQSFDDRILHASFSRCSRRPYPETVTAVLGRVQTSFIQRLAYGLHQTLTGQRATI